MTIHKLTLSPANITIDVNSDEVLLTQLKKQGINLKSSCGGHATCGECVVKVMEGAECLSGSTFEEMRLLGNLFHLTKERLCCQTKIKGDVVIDVTNHEKHIEENMPVSKKPQVHLKKRENVERKSQEIPEENVDPSWYRHWEKKDAGENMMKRVGGNKRPKAFKHSKPDIDEK